MISHAILQPAIRLVAASPVSISDASALHRQRPRRIARDFLS
jgi:hypothetical protein